MSVSTFNIPVLSQSLPQADSIIQVVDVLGKLNAIADQMFNKLRDKAETQKRIIDSITARINAASAKAAQLRKTESVCKSTVVISPSSYPIKQTPSHYQNVFTPISGKPDADHAFCAPPMVSSRKEFHQKLGPSLAPANSRSFGDFENDDLLGFSVMEKTVSKKYEVGKDAPFVPRTMLVDEFVTFGAENPKKRRLSGKKIKKRDDVDPGVWEDFMSQFNRDTGLNYVPGFDHFPSATHLPDHLMTSNVATNISYKTEKLSDTIAPSILLNLPMVGNPTENPSNTHNNESLIPVDQTTPSPPPVQPSIPLPPPPQVRPTLSVPPTPPIQAFIPPPPPPPAPIQPSPSIPLPPPPPSIRPPTQPSLDSPTQPSATAPRPPPPPPRDLPPPTPIAPRPEFERPANLNFQEELEKRIREKNERLALDPVPIEIVKQSPPPPSEDGLFDELKKRLEKVRKANVASKSEIREKAESDDDW